MLKGTNMMRTRTKLRTIKVMTMRAMVKPVVERYLQVPPHLHHLLE